MSIAVERVDGAFRSLILEYPIPMEQRWGAMMPKYFPQRPKFSPKMVEVDIRRAIAGGWDPQSRGKVFVFQVLSIILPSLYLMLSAHVPAKIQSISLWYNSPQRQSIL
jgi:hypothetical protein